MPAYLSPIGNSQIVDVNGNPLNGGKIKTFLAGTTTPADAYTTSAGDVLQPNPIILNSLGWSPNPLFLKAGVAYKIIFEDSAGVQVGQTFDNITGINDPSQVALSTPEWMPATFAISYVSGTVFSATGDQTLTLPAGIRVKTTNTGGTAYSRVLSSVFSLGFTTVTLLNDSLALDSGLSALSYSILSPTNPSLPNSQAARDSLGVPYAIGRNLLINSSMFVNQDNRTLGVSNITLAAYEYLIDGWRAGDGGAVVNFSIISTQGDAKIMTIVSGSIQCPFEWYRIQGLGYTYTLSWAGGAKGNLYNTSVIGGNTPNGTSPVRGGLSSSPFPSTYYWIEFGVGTVSKPQLEFGSTQTPYEYKTASAELIECQRFHVRVTGIDGITGWGSGRQSSTTGSRIWINPPVAMYAKPTVVFSGVQLDYSGGITAATASTVYSSKNQVMMDVTHAAVGAASAGVGLQIPNGVANYIELNARL